MEPPLESLSTEKSKYRGLLRELQRERYHWEQSKVQRCLEMNNHGDLNKYRYLVWPGTIYEDHNPIDLCLDPLLLDRSKIDLSTRVLKKECRVRGYTLMGGIAAALGGIYSTVIKGVSSHPVVLNCGLGLYVGTMALVGILMARKLYEYIDSEVISLQETRDQLMEKTTDRISPFAVKVTYRDEWTLWTPPLQVQTNRLAIAGLKGMTEDQLRQEDRVVSLLKTIKRPIDVIGLKGSVYWEMIICFVISASLAILIRLILGSTTPAAPPPR